MPFPVFFDTCTLYPAVAVDVILRIAEEGAFAPHWSPTVLAELERNLAIIPTVGAAGAARRIAAMELSFPDASVSHDDALIESMTCSPEDRHVRAGAIAARCQVLVTYNVKDFPEESTRAHDIDVVPPDQFLLDQLELHPRWVIRSLLGKARDSRRPPLSPAGLLDALDRSGLSGFTTEVIRRYPIVMWELMS